jgi:hypothetical protein
VSSKPATHHRQRPARNPHLASATGCTSNSEYSFVGFSDPTSGPNYAGGDSSGVLSGALNEACDLEDGIAAGEANGIGNNGGAEQSFIGAGFENVITGTDAVIGGGNRNFAAQYAFVGGGAVGSASGTGSVVVGGGYEYFSAQNFSIFSYGNMSTGTDAFIGAGDLNLASGSGSVVAGGGYAYAATGATAVGNQVKGTDSFIGAGDQNSVAANEAIVGAGQSNTIASAATYAVVAGGSMNAISGLSGAIGGGSSNTVTGQYGTVSGGDGNLASGNAATVAGGYKNLASGQFSFAAGFGSHADTNGSFVWSDDSPTSGHLTPTAANEFIARATGGVVFLTNAAETTGVKLAAGGGAWASASDRNLKRDVTNINDAEVLAKVAALPVAEWSYASERGVRHVGPMAQDFYAAFKVGEDDRHITSIDEDGVALAAIKALHHENAGLHAENAALRERLARDEARRTRDEARHVRELAALEGQIRALAENAHLAIYRKASR